MGLRAARAPGPEYAVTQCHIYAWKWRARGLLPYGIRKRFAVWFTCMNVRVPETRAADYIGLGRHTCPACGAPMSRITRRFLDRLSSLFQTKHRYRCRSFSCQWEGILPARNASSGNAGTGLPR